MLKNILNFRHFLNLIWTSLKNWHPEFIISHGNILLELIAVATTHFALILIALLVYWYVQLLSSFALPASNVSSLFLPWSQRTFSKHCHYLTSVLSKFMYIVEAIDPFALWPYFLLIFFSLLLLASFSCHILKAEVP